jgi:serine/threonine-protein kinase
VYALGVILYELLAGRLPFELADRTPNEAVALILEGPLQRPSAVVHARGSAWGELDVLCLTAMHRDAARRYATVDALIRDVDHYLHGEPLEARPDSFGYRARKFVGRHRRGVATAVAALVVLIALVGFYTVRLRAARNTAVAQAARTERIQRFMLTLFEGGDPNEGPADSLRVVTLLDQGVQQAASLGNEPAVQAELHHTLGGIYEKLGRLDRADTLLTRALAERRALHGSEDPDVATSLVALGLLRVEQARVPEGEKLVRDGLAMTRRLRPPDHPDIAAADVALGRALQARGAFDEAIRVLDEAVRLQSASGTMTRDLAVTLNVLAVAHLYAGHFPVADSIYRRALATDRQLYGPGHPQIGTDLSDLASVLFEQGSYAESERLYRQGLAIFERWYGPDHPQTAGILMLLAQPLIKQSRAAEAMPLLERALAIQERVYGRVHPRVAGTLNALGAAAGEQGRQAEAERYYGRTAEIFRAVYGPEHYLVGASLGNEATTWIERGDGARAERLLRDALRIYAKALPPEHPYVGIARLKLGRALVRQARWRDAERELTAGYAIVSKGSAPSSPWLVKGRQDLVATYEALGQPDRAAPYRVAPAADSARAPGGR